MPETIQCEACGTRILGYSTGEPKPLSREDCPKCGAETFSRLGEE